MPAEREPLASLIPSRFSELSASWKVLVSTMHNFQYGRFEHLKVHDREPVFDPPPRLVRVKRIGSAEETAVSASEDWILKAPIVDLLRELAAFGNGTVERLEFRRGLPCLLEFAIPAKSDPNHSGKGSDA